MCFDGGWIIGFQKYAAYNHTSHILLDIRHSNVQIHFFFVVTMFFSAISNSSSEWRNLIVITVLPTLDFNMAN